MKSIIFKYLNRLGTIYFIPKKIYMGYSIVTFRSSIVQKYIHYGILKDNYDDNCTTYCDHFPSKSTISQIFCGDGLKLEIPYQPYLNVVQINKIYYLIFLFDNNSLPKIKCRHYPTMVQHQKVN